MSLTQVFGEHLHDDLRDKLFKDKKLVISGLSNQGAKAFFLELILNRTARPVFYVCQDEEELKEMQKILSLFFQKELLIFSDKDEERVILSKIINFQRSEELKIFLTTAKNISFKSPHLSHLKSHALNLKKGEKKDSIDFINELIDLGYENSEDTFLEEGFFKSKGDTIELRPIASLSTIKINFAFDEIENIESVNEKKISELKNLEILPAKFVKTGEELIKTLNSSSLVISDELESLSETQESHLEDLDCLKIKITSFPKENEQFEHMRYLSMLNFYSLVDFVNDLRNKIHANWKTVIFTKREKEIAKIFNEEKIPYGLPGSSSSVIIMESSSQRMELNSFQNPEKKIALIGDKEIFTLKKAARNQSVSKMNIDFIASLKEEDYVIHFDHGIGKFEGIVKREIQEISREYLEISFALNDKLFVPVENADKVNKYITDDEQSVVLSKLGSSDWQKQVKKAKKETEQLAKDLLELYAKRAQAKRDPFLIKEKDEEKFAHGFPYVETPGQIKAIMDVKKDMESNSPMDRLVCGDVGFGKTEVAMRASFKAVMAGKQVAFISPITILAEQHLRSFKKRMQGFDIKIEMLSRFKTDAEQKEIIEKMKKGKIDIVIGTHRLLQKDINFSNLGLLIIDEEQRFGVQQKETLKKLRSKVDILTLTATPIPRTLNLSLNKLRDITTITTPPPGRMPIITEVRKYSTNLIRDSILKEINRGGQVYFLHNRVETIESMADRLRDLVPEASFTVAHGQMSPRELEDKIRKFKNAEVDVLVSSTIIENGIDLSNANTMLINNADKFGLSQLYQLRGRIGRSSKQAYAYLLYSSQKLSVDAKKRLRALIEASELGSGFQIAMRDLEIRGAGEILGSSQHGSMKSVGIGHFLKMLQKTIKEMKDGTYLGDKEIQASDINIDLPIDAYIPDNYISVSREKMSVYQKLASVDDLDLLQEFYQDIEEEYGPMPRELKNLFKVLRLKYFARFAGVVKIQSKNMGYEGRELYLYLGKLATPDKIMKVLEKNKKWIISGSHLKINFKDLGFLWFDEIIDTIERMAVSKKI